MKYLLSGKYTRNKMKKQNKKGSKKPKYDLTYFLDHPQIQRHECVGNQTPSMADKGTQKNFEHVGKAAGHSQDRAQQIEQSKEKQSQSRSFSGAIDRMFGK